MHALILLFALCQVDLYGWPEEFVPDSPELPIEEVDPFLITVYSTQHCDPCKRLKSDAARQKQFKFVFIEDRKKFPEWVKGTPALSWRFDSADVEHHEHGWLNMGNWLRRYQVERSKWVQRAPKVRQ